MLKSIEHEIATAHKNYNAEKIEIFLASRLSSVVLVMLIIVKMPTIVGILTFLSMIKFMLS